MALAPPRVVIVDDHRLFRTGVKAELGDRVTVVAEAEDIAEAVAVIEQWSPDVVLLDVHLPSGTGREVIDAIQRDGTCWCGATVWQGRTAMRISVSSWATNDEDVEKSLHAMIGIARRLTNSSA